ncbi:MAG: hypothetical protein FWE46_03025 [Coriobacteriia bacterium]|nr:hypothetical protein [Coriobacteriia bacterium]MCL2537013.1 hypothetical protein [Coriobacteriia bacterium]
MNTKKLFPQAGVRTQLLYCSIMWLIGAMMILRLAMIYLATVGSVVWWIPPVGLLLGLIKAYWLMIPAAANSIKRINEKGRDWIFNALAPKSYIMIGGMMTAGILLRTLGPNDQTGYQIFLATAYLVIGIGLFMSAGVFLAVLRRKYILARQAEEEMERAEAR